MSQVSESGFVGGTRIHLFIAKRCQFFLGMRFYVFFFSA